MSLLATDLEPLTPHEAPHTFASYLIANGMNPKQVQTYVGHTDIRATFNRYGHLLDGDVDTARRRSTRCWTDRPAGPVP